MPNPVLNDKVFADERVHTLDAPRPHDIAVGAPAGPAWRTTMTLDGVVVWSLGLFLVLAAAAAVGWRTVEQDELGTPVLPGFFFPVLIGALVLALVTSFKRETARFTAPLYAVLEGLFAGVLSAVYEIRYEGIVGQALLLTGGVFVAMLVLFSKRIVVVTDRLARGISAATLGVFLVYVAALLMRVFGAQMPFLHEATPLGILISLAIVGIAAANLLLAFDVIERGVGRAPKWMEAYAAFGLLVTLVWLYLELLRLLSKLRER